MAGVSTGRDVCPQYEKLLSNCQEALSSWQQSAALISRNTRLGRNATAELKRLEANYRRAYAMLDGHEHACPDCQYVSKIAGLDFECMASALNLYRRSA
jgi:hypothetical protein